MPAGVYTIVAEQGAAFARAITYENPEGTLVDLTGYTARMQVRRRPYSATAILELTTENGGITLGGLAGTIDLSIAATTMGDAPSGKNYYDLELIPPSGEEDVVRLIEGTFTITQEVTKP